MTTDLMNQLKSDFNFLNISDEVFEQILSKCIDKKKNNDENKKRVYSIFYKIVRDKVADEGKYTDIISYIENNFDNSDIKKAINSLNKLTQFLEKCEIDINKDNYNKLVNNTPKLKKCLDLIVNSKEMTEEEKNNLLDEKSSIFLDSYMDENSNFLVDNTSVEELLEEAYEEMGDEDTDYSIYTNDHISAYYKSIRKYPILTQEEEYRLTKIYKETHNKEIRDRIIHSNLRFVVSVAKKINKSHRDFYILDLVSAGNEGLFRALEDYDPDKARFTTYAGPWIYQKIMCEIHNNSNNIRIPNAKHDKMRMYFKKKEQLEIELGREATISEIKQHLGYSDSQINEYENNMAKTISLNTKIIDEKDTSELIDLIADNNSANPEETLVQKDPGYINMLFSKLTETEKMVMKLRTGIYDGTEYTLEDIGKMLHKLNLKSDDITRERVRQIENKAKRKIKRNKELYEHNLVLMGENKQDVGFDNHVVTISDFIFLLKNTDKQIMPNIINRLCKSYRVALEECFGNNVLEGRLKEGVTSNMIKHLLTNVYPRIFYEVRKQERIKEISETILPKNIFKIDEKYDKDDIEERIDCLEPCERIRLYKLYDIYTGDLLRLDKVSLNEKEEGVKVIEKIKIGLIQYSTPIKVEKIILSKNKLFEYFGVENKESVVAIINSLQDEEKEFLQMWHGENYDIDPRINGDLYKKMDKYRRDKIYCKIKLRLDRFNELKEKNPDLTIEEFIETADICRGPKNKDKVLEKEKKND